MPLRLSKTVSISHYNLTFEVDPVSEKFACHQKIELSVIKSGTSFTLNSENLDIESVQWDGTNREFTIDKEENLLVIKKDVVAGESFTLSISCSGTMGKDMYGIYRSSYGDEDEKDGDDESVENPESQEESSQNSVADAVQSLDISEDTKAEEYPEKFLVSTQFEPLGARRAFPCIDDPALKATFTISLVHPLGLVALSNSEKSLEKTEGKWTTTTFEKSPLMLTYLVAFAVGDLECVKSEKFPLSVYTVPGQSENAKFGLEAAEQCLPFYEELFGYKYPLSKLDMIAVPDFSKSAMENFGLITFKESDLLVNLDRASQYQKEECFETVAHEISHQWFGNLVTMDFWEDLWLNEGFATWMLWYAMDHFHPDWKVWENYVVYTLLSAFMADTTGTRPIIMPIENNNDIEHAGDDITYKKGCAVVVMLFEFLGEQNFFAGLKKYIEKYAWSNAVSADLWNCLEEVSGEKVEKLMSCWTTKSGFPIVEVKETESHLVLKQKKYGSSGNSDTELFSIPITIKTSEGLIKFILSEHEKLVDLPKGSYIINPGHTGYYLTKYPLNRYFSISEADISTVDRIGILLDIDLLSGADGELAAVFLQLAEKFIHYKDPQLLNAIVESYFDLLDVFVYDEQTWSKLCEFGQKLIGEYVSSSFVKDDDENEDFNKTILRFAAFIRDPRIDQFCDSKFEEFVKDTELLDADECTIVLRNVVRRKDRQTWEVLWKIFEDEEDIFIQEDILASLGNLTDASTIEHFLGLILTSSLIKAQDIILCLRPIVNIGLGIDCVWGWLQKTWTEIGEKLEFGSVTHVDVVNACVLNLCTKIHSREIEEFFKDKDLEVFGSTMEKTREKIEKRVARYEKSKAVVESHLKVALEK